MQPIVRPIIAAVALATLVPGCGRQPAGPVVENAYVRLPAVAGNPAAGYFRIGGGRSDDRLLSVAATGAARAELHASMAHGGAMTMAPLAGVDVPAGGTVAFAPAGRHVMLFGLSRAVVRGSTLPIILRFRSGAVVHAEATAIAAGDAPPGGA